MKLGISAVTAHRKFGKALVRVSQELVALKARIPELGVRGTRFGSVLVMLEDESTDFTEVLYGRDDVCQVDVGMGEDLSFLPEDDELLLARIAAQVRKAVAASPLPEHDRDLLVECIDEWRTEYASPKICEP